VFPKIATQSHYPVAFQSRPVGPESFCVVLPSALLVARTACIPTAWGTLLQAGTLVLL
jgi:hypothetical protein